jgi:hypothetical protein
VAGPCPSGPWKTAHERLRILDGGRLILDQLVVKDDSVEFALDRGDVRFTRSRDLAAAALADPELHARALRPLDVDPAVYPDRADATTLA